MEYCHYAERPIEHHQLPKWRQLRVIFRLLGSWQFFRWKFRPGFDRAMEREFMATGFVFGCFGNSELCSEGRYL
jgi:hypothetical protein